MEKLLKTNRSMGLYIGLTIAVKLLPAAVAVLVAWRIMSGLSGYAKIALWGLIGGGTDGLVKSLAEIAAGLMIPVLIAGILTLAYFIYVVVLFHGVCDDINKICGQKKISGGSPIYFFVLLLSAITLNIYYVFWSHQQGKRLEEASKAYRCQIQSSAKFHLVFAILGSVPVWFYFLASAILKNASLGVITGGYAVCFILGFLDICNMAGFIRDVNILAALYNSSPKESDSRLDGQKAAVPSQAAPGNRAGADQITMPVQEWVMERGHTEVPAKAAGGFMEGCAGIYEGAVIPIEGETMIGRDEMSCHVVIKSPEVSRKHCAVSYNGENGTYIVTDYSSNGTFYKNGQAFPKNVPVSCNAGTILVIAQSGNEFLLK